MDIVQLVREFGPWGALLVVTLVWLQRMLAGGIKLTVRHDEKQMVDLRDTIGAAAGQLDRLAAVEAVHDGHDARLGDIETRVTKLEVQVDERTKRRTSGRPTRALPDSG